MDNFTGFFYMRVASELHHDIVKILYYIMTVNLIIREDKEVAEDLTGESVPYNDAQYLHTFETSIRSPAIVLCCRAPSQCPMLGRTQSLRSQEITPPTDLTTHTQQDSYLAPGSRPSTRDGRSLSCQPARNVGRSCCL